MISKKILSLLLLLITAFLSLLYLNSCRNSDKEQLYFNTSGIDAAEFTYDAITNTTEIIWSMEITNKSVCDFEDLTATFQLYGATKAAELVTVKVESIKHQSTFYKAYTINVEGNISSLRLIDFTQKRVSFFNTHKSMIIMTITTVTVIFLFFVFFSIKSSSRLKNINSFLKENISIVLILLILLTFIVTIYGIAASSFMTSIIMLAGVLSLILLICVFNTIRQSALRLIQTKKRKTIY